VEFPVNKHPKQKNFMPIVLLAPLIGSFFLGNLFSQSLAELARQERARMAREGKPAKVYTNEDIARTPPPAPPVAPAAAAAGEAAKKEAAGGEKAAAGGKEEAKPAGESEKNQADLEKEYRDRFAKLREQLDYETKKADVMQRELNLMQTQFYSDPNVALREQTSRGEINQRTQDIDKQKDAVEKAKQAITDLEDELQKKGLPSGWAR
jgi:hypothetical protein